MRKSANPLSVSAGDRDGDLLEEACRDRRCRALDVEASPLEEDGFTSNLSAWTSCNRYNCSSYGCKVVPRQHRCPIDEVGVPMG